jgi:hypothetical protein
MTTQLEIYNMALLHLRETILADLNEDREARYTLDLLWAPVRQVMLESGFWKFAIRTVKIESDPDVVPNFGLPLAFNKPADWVKTYLVSASEMMDPPHYDWVEEANQFFSNVDPLFLRYVSNATPGYGHDPSKWTAKFTEAFSFELAWRAAPKVTGASDSLLDRLEANKKAALSTALSFEALREPTRRPPQGKFNSVRFARPIRIA